jgi:hypothetical protein
MPFPTPARPQLHLYSKSTTVPFLRGMARCLAITSTRDVVDSSSEKLAVLSGLPMDSPTLENADVNSNSRNLQAASCRCSQQQPTGTPGSAHQLWS